MEQRILNIQQKLSDLRQDRSQFFTVTNVMDIYKDFKDAVDTMSPENQKQLSPIISDCVLIFSLAFNTVGFTREPIAVYAKAVTLITVFKFICWDPAFTQKELTLLKASINSVSESLSLEDTADIPVIDFVDAQIRQFSKDLSSSYSCAMKAMNTLPEDEYAVHSQVTHMRRIILAEVITKNFNSATHASMKNKLDKIIAHVDGHDSEGAHARDSKQLAAEADNDTHNGSPLLRYQLKKASTLIELFQNGVVFSEMDSEDKSLRPMFEVLADMLPVLDVFVMTRRWTLRVTDLYQHMKTLLRMLPNLGVGIARVDFTDEISIPVPVKQAQKYRYLLTYMARRAWALIFKLLDTMEPVSEALYALYNQLLTMKRCLREVRLAGGISNLRELYPYQLKLASLDNLRRDGKFVVGNEVPPGQGVLNGMLAECFDIVYELKVELEEKGEDFEDSNIVEDENDEDEDELSDSDVDNDCDSDSGDDASLALEFSSKTSSVRSDDHAHDHLADVPDANE